MCSVFFPKEFEVYKVCLILIMLNWFVLHCFDTFFFTMLKTFLVSLFDTGVASTHMQHKKSVVVGMLDNDASL